MDPTNEEQEEEQRMLYGRNYYADQLQTAEGLKYRLSGDDIVVDTIDQLRGGYILTKYGEKIHQKAEAMMNIKGIAAARTFLMGVVNKNTHLTMYENEARVMAQMRGLARQWAYSATRKRKLWAVTDPGIVNQIIENALLNSMQRGKAGFEAGLTSKSMMVQEVHNINDQQRGGQGIISRLNPLNWGGKNG